MDMLISGLAYVLGHNVDTDQIIPAEHLVYSLKDPEESKLYGRYALSGVPEKEAGLPQGQQPFVQADAFHSPYQIVVGGENFGCGSSREHAPFALRQAGVKAVVAKSYARIFFRNSVDGGFYPPLESQELLTERIQTGDELLLDLNHSVLHNKTRQEQYALQALGDILEILQAGNIFAYAKQKGLIDSKSLK